MELARIGEALVKTIHKAYSVFFTRKGLIEKQELEKIAEEVVRGMEEKLEFTGDDWIYDSQFKKEIVPSETASIALTKRDEEGNIIATGIAALYIDFPIILADDSGAFIYKEGMIAPVEKVDTRYLKSDLPIRAHIFGQKTKIHWVWMNQIIGYLNSKGIRTDNNMGPYFIVRDFFFNFRPLPSGGVEITPLNAVITEPFLNKPKEEIGAFIINSLNKRLSENEKFFISDMSGQPLFKEGKIRKIDTPVCPVYCASGWIAGPTEEIVRDVLGEMKKAVNEIGIPSKANEKIKKLVSDLAHYD